MRNSDEEWVYTVRGKSFLRYMVRKIAGHWSTSGWEIPTGRYGKSFSKCAIAPKSGPTMPPRVCVLRKVEYTACQLTGRNVGESVSRAE